MQPASPLELWTTPPYEPAIRDDRVWARGATDNKGEFLPRVWAVEAWLEAIGPLPPLPWAPPPGPPLPVDDDPPVVDVS